MCATETSLGFSFVPLMRASIAREGRMPPHRPASCQSPAPPRQSTAVPAWRDRLRRMKKAERRSSVRASERGSVEAWKRRSVIGGYWHCHYVPQERNVVHGQAIFLQRTKGSAQANEATAVIAVVAVLLFARCPYRRAISQKCFENLAVRDVTQPATMPNSSRSDVDRVVN